MPPKTDLIRPPSPILQTGNNIEFGGRGGGALQLQESSTYNSTRLAFVSHSSQKRKNRWPACAFCLVRQCLLRRFAPRFPLPRSSRSFRKRSTKKSTLRSFCHIPGSSTPSKFHWSGNSIASLCEASNFPLRSADTSSLPQRPQYILSWKRNNVQLSECSTNSCCQASIHSCTDLRLIMLKEASQQIHFLLARPQTIKCQGFEGKCKWGAHSQLSIDILKDWPIESVQPMLKACFGNFHASDPRMYSRSNSKAAHRTRGSSWPKGHRHQRA